MIKSFGITCDNYKTSKFEERLKKEGYTYTINPLGSKLTFIKIITDADNKDHIQKICEDIETYFKGLKN